MTNKLLVLSVTLGSHVTSKHKQPNIYTYLHISTISSIISNKGSSKLLRNCLIGMLWTEPTVEVYDQCNLS